MSDFRFSAAQSQLNAVLLPALPERKQKFLIISLTDTHPSQSEQKTDRQTDRKADQTSNNK